MSKLGSNSRAELVKYTKEVFFAYEGIDLMKNFSLNDQNETIEVLLQQEIKKLN